MYSPFLVLEWVLFKFTLAEQYNKLHSDILYAQKYAI